MIFELKRGIAGEDAVLQAIGYAQKAGRWQFADLERRYKTYAESTGSKNVSLQEAHKEAFEIDPPLLPAEFNRRQILYVVGSAANEDLISAIDYWKKQGLAVEFLPYRVYKIGKERYFEFFSLPYDRHRNPGAVKGVLFDTNRSYDENSIWEMMEKSRVAAYGKVKHVVEYLSKGDIVFFSHKWRGIVGAAEVTGSVKSEEPEEKYRDVRFLTPVPKKEEGIRKAMSFGQVSQVTGKSFFWARTIKVPYLSRGEAEKLLDELKKVLQT